MNRKNNRLFGLALLALMGTAAWAQTPPAVQKITILPSRLNARILLEAAVPLPALAAAYTAGETPQLLVEFGPAKWPEPPAVPADETPLVKDIKVMTKSNGRSELLLTLTGKVPFRVFSEGSRTIIELEKILRGTEDYLIAPDVQSLLGGADRPITDLPAVDIAARADRLIVSARRGQPAIANVFALGNPLRLIVDIFDCRYIGPTEKRPIGKFGVESVRVGQFMSAGPYTITRLVFDLRDPGLSACPADLPNSRCSSSLRRPPTPLPPPPPPRRRKKPRKRPPSRTASGRIPAPSSSNPSLSRRTIPRRLLPRRRSRPSPRRRRKKPPLLKPTSSSPGPSSTPSKNSRVN